jgi:hypothetical protein
MLNRIRNIEPGSDYRKAGKFKGFGNSTKLISSSFINISDSKDFSPSLEFLAKVNWKLINLKFKSKESLFLALKYGNYEFSTEIDLLDQSYLTSLIYDVATTIKERGIENRITATFTTPVTYDKDINEISSNSLAPLDTMFERYDSLNIDYELKQSDGSLIENLVIDIQKELEELFDYINKIFLTFIKKLIQLPKMEKFDSESYSDGSVILKSIKAITD